MIEYKSQSMRFRLACEPSDFKKVKIRISKDAAEYARNFYHDDIIIYESFFIVLLNQSNNTIGWAKIGQGGINETVTDPLLIAKYAIDSLSKNVILVHNHPSGNMKASQNDINLTNKIKKMLNYLDIGLLDHIILSETSYFSFGDEGIL